MLIIIIYKLLLSSYCHPDHPHIFHPHIPYSHADHSYISYHYPQQISYISYHYPQQIQTTVNADTNVAEHPLRKYWNWKEHFINTYNVCQWICTVFLKNQMAASVCTLGTRSTTLFWIFAMHSNLKSKTHPINLNWKCHYQMKSKARESSKFRSKEKSHWPRSRAMSARTGIHKKCCQL